MVGVATTNEPDRWMGILEEVGEYDFYHLPAYQHLTEIEAGGQAVLPMFRCNGYAMAFPLLLRDIRVPGVETSGYRDAACVPGLTGPVISHRHMPDTVRHQLMEQFQDYLMQNGIVSVYSRLHFMLGQEAFLLGSGFGAAIEEGIEVTLDLTAPPDEQFPHYWKGHRSDIKKLQRMGLVFEQVGPEYLDEFMRLYYATMDRVGATQHFYREKSHFEYLLSEMKDYFHFFVCRDGSTITCTLLLVVCNDHLHGYRVGLSDEYRKLGLSKFVYHETRKWGNSIGAKVFHFGGGVTGGRDALYDFKMGFGGREHPCSTWRHIADREAYENLCRQAFARSGKVPDDDYFPEYRSPSLGLGKEAKAA